MSIFTRDDLRRSRDGIPPMQRKTRSDPKGECNVDVTELTRLKVEFYKDMKQIENDDISHYEY